MGVSLGIGPVDDTLGRIGAHRDQGYKPGRHQILPGHDLVLVRAAREALAQAQLTVDATCPYTPADTAVLAERDRFDLDCIEQPLAWDDIHDHATLQPRLKTPICLDECIKTAAHAR